MTKHLTARAALVLVLCLAVPAPAQQQPSPEQPAQPPRGQLYSIEVIHVDPASAAEYEAALTRGIAAIREQGMSGETFTFYTHTGINDFTYTYVTPLESMGSLDRMEKDWEAFMQKLGPARMRELGEAIERPMRSYDRFVVREAPELSYLAPGAEAADSPSPRSCTYELYLTKPGSERAIREFGAAIKNHVTGKKWPHTYRVYRTESGMDLPAWTVTFCGKSQLELAQIEERWQQMLGPEGAQLFEKQLLPHLRKMQLFQSRFRPDLSNLPGQAQPAARQ